MVTASLLTATASTPIWGRLADLYNKKTLLQVAVALFLVGSVACGFAQSTAQLIGFRAIQGLGMGALQVLVQVIIAAIIPPKERGKYNGYLGGVMAVATVGGPLLGGLIADTDWLGWRWCFFISVPFCVVAWALLFKTLKIETVRREGVVIDYAGATLIAAGVSLLLVWITFVDNSFAWVSWQTGVMVGGVVVILGLALWVESRAKEPVVPLHVIRQRTPALAILASLAVGMALFGGAVFLGQYYQVGRGFSPTEAGLMTIPMMAGVLLSSTISGQIISPDRQGPPVDRRGREPAHRGLPRPVPDRPQHLDLDDHPLDDPGRRGRRHGHAEPRARPAEHRRPARPGRGQRRDHLLPLLGGTIGVSILARSWPTRWRPESAKATSSTWRSPTRPATSSWSPRASPPSA